MLLTINYIGLGEFTRYEIGEIEYAKVCIII